MKTYTPRVIIFDWDGTLCDSIDLIVDCFKVAARRIDLAIPPDEKIRYTIGMDLPGAMNYLFGGLSPERTAEFVAAYREYYLTRVNELELFPGARDCLEHLRDEGTLLAIATGKNRVGLDRVLRITDSEHFFQVTRCSDESGPKPAPGMVLHILSELELLPDQALVVGDTTHDLRMAAAAGCPGLAVSFGAHTEEALQAESPLGMLHDIRDLLPFLSELRQAAP